MNLHRYLVLAALTFSGLAVVGCADVPDDEATEVGGSEDELKAQAQKFVGDYQWDPGSTFTDFEKLSLDADGSYKANVEASLVRKVFCVAFPCTQPEAGKWTTTKSNGKLKLSFAPNGKKPTRSYFVSLSKGELSLTRYNKTTKLLVESAGTSCALIRCAAGTKCVDGPSGGECVPNVTCAAMLCAPNTKCVDGPNGGECVLLPTCAATLCAAGTTCEDTPSGAKCVPNAPCVVSGCSGEICADSQMFSPCIFKPEFACYKKATCERQAGGECGWTKTPALDACLANP